MKPANWIVHLRGKEKKGETKSEKKERKRPKKKEIEEVGRRKEGRKGKERWRQETKKEMRFFTQISI